MNEPNSKGFSLMEILLVVISVAIIGGISYLYIAKSPSVNDIPPTPSPGDLLLPTLTPTPDPTTVLEVFTNDEYGFTFKYPVSIDFDTDCCIISGPQMGLEKYSKTFAVSDTVMPNSDAPFDGFSIYIMELWRTQSFEEYIDMEKIKLTENHELMTGTTPVNPSEVSITVDGQTGTILRNYAWWVDDMTYIPHPDGTHVVVIPHMNVTDDFPSQFDQILDSFTFTNE